MESVAVCILAPAARTSERKIASPPYFLLGGAFIWMVGSVPGFGWNISLVEFLQVSLQSGVKLRFVPIFSKGIQLFAVIPDLYR